MAWTNIAKPTGMGYTNIAKPVNTIWTNTEIYLPAYDEATITYDSATTFYDGIDQSAWTNIGFPIFLDQKQLVTTTSEGFGTVNVQKMAQSFKPSFNYNLYQIVLQIGAVPGSHTDNVQLDIFSDNAGKPGSSLVTADNQLVGSSLSTSSDQTIVPVSTFNFLTTNVKLTQDTRYWMVLSRTGIVGNDNYTIFSDFPNDASNPYSRGTNAYYFDGSNWINDGNDHAWYFSVYTNGNWVNLVKPSGGKLITRGMAMGVLGLTYSVQELVGPWTLVLKPS